MRTLVTAVSLIAALVAADAASAAAAPAKKKPAAAAPKPPPYQAGRPALKVRPKGDDAIILTIADAMGFVRTSGNNTINRVQLRGAGRMTVDGKVYAVPAYIYTLSLRLKATREDIKRTAAGKSDRLVRVVLDKDAWDEKEPGVEGRAASESALDRRLKLARTPFGFTRALLDAPKGSVKVVDPGPGGRVIVTFPVEGVETKAVLNAEYRPESITQVVGGKTIVDRYPDYRDLSEYGVMFPTKWVETVNGAPYLDLNIDDGRIASYAVFPKPDTLTASR